jgi:hypothetical protein
VFATLAWVIYILSPSFIFFSDVLFEFPYFIFLDWFFLSRVILFKEKLENSSSFSLSCWFWQFFGLGFLAVWFSLDEMIPFLSLSLVLWFVGDGRLGKVQRGSLVLAAVVGSALSFGIHIAQNASVLGGWYPAFENFHRVFQVRIGEIDTGDIHQKYSLAKHVGKYFLAMQWFYTWPMILLALTGWLMRLRHCLMNPAQGRFWLGLGLSTALGAFSWQILMRQHSMIHAFTVRHADIWVILGVANFLVFAKTNYQKVVAAVCGLIFLVHLPLCVLQIEGTFVKRTLICHLIASAERPAWACGQASAVFHSTELPGAKSIVQEMLPNSCAEVPAHPSGIRAIFSGVILYWR